MQERQTGRSPRRREIGSSTVRRLESRVRQLEQKLGDASGWESSTTGGKSLVEFEGKSYTATEQGLLYPDNGGYVPHKKVPVPMGKLKEANARKSEASTLTFAQLIDRENAPIDNNQEEKKLKIAYKLWEKRGRRDGHDFEDYYDAEEALNQQKNQSDEEQQKRELAYKLWEKEGRPEDRGGEFWRRAEDILDVLKEENKESENITTEQVPSEDQYDSVGEETRKASQAEKENPSNQNGVQASQAFPATSQGNEEREQAEARNSSERNDTTQRANEDSQTPFRINGAIVLPPPNGQTTHTDGNVNAENRHSTLNQDQEGPTRTTQQTDTHTQTTPPPPEERQSNGHQIIDAEYRTIPDDQSRTRPDEPRRQQSRRRNIFSRIRDAFRRGPRTAETQATAANARVEEHQAEAEANRAERDRQREERRRAREARRRTTRGHGVRNVALGTVLGAMLGAAVALGADQAVRHPNNETRTPTPSSAPATPRPNEAGAPPALALEPTDEVGKRALSATSIPTPHAEVKTSVSEETKKPTPAPGTETVVKLPELPANWPKTPREAGERFGVNPDSRDPNRWEQRPDGAWVFKEKENGERTIINQLNYIMEAHLDTNSDKYNPQCFVVLAHPGSVHGATIYPLSGEQEAKKLLNKIGQTKWPYGAAHTCQPVGFKP